MIEAEVQQTLFPALAPEVIVNHVTVEAPPRRLMYWEHCSHSRAFKTWSRGGRCISDLKCSICGHVHTVDSSD